MPSLGSPTLVEERLVFFWLAGGGGFGVDLPCFKQQKGDLEDPGVLKNEKSFEGCRPWILQ